jgi:hypothetical protein
MGQKAPLVYCVVVNWNRPHDSADCIHSLIIQKDVQTRVLLVDNGSSDDSVAILKEQFNNIDILTSAQNLWFSGGYNLGIKYALDQGAEYIFIINNDAYVAPETLSILLKQINENKNVGLVAPIIYYASHPDQIWSSGGNIRRIILEYTNQRGEIDKGYLPNIMERDFVTGCCFLTTKSVFLSVGFFDDSFKMYYEDADFCLRTRKNNLRIMVIPKAKAWHKVSLSSGGVDSPIERFWMAKSSILFIKKHSSKWQLLFIIPWRTASAIKTIFRLMSNAQYASLQAYISGIVQGLRVNIHKTDLT